MDSMVKDIDVHLYKLREMDENPALERMVHAYEMDYAVQSE